MKTLITAAALAGASLLANQSVAAGAPPEAAVDSLRHRWAIGLRYAGTPNFYSFGRFLPTVSYQWHPRWSVELGVSYWRSRSGYTSSVFTVDGAPLEYKFKGQTTRAAVPIRVRYTLTRKADRRLQFDALGGISLNFAGGKREYILLDNAVEIDRSQSSFSAVYGLAGLGIGGRYGLGPNRRLELLAELTLYQEVASGIRPDYRLQQRLRFKPVGYWGLGVRYKL